MKRTVIFVIGLILSVFALSCCNREPSKEVAGDYTYKISGSLLAVGDTSNTCDTIRYKLSRNSGQMSVVSSDGDHMIISTDRLFGEVGTYNATMVGDTLVLEPFKQKVTLTPDVTLGIAIHPTLDIEGWGKKYDDVLLFTFEYNGLLEHKGVAYRIISTDIVCRAKQNN